MIIKGLIVWIIISEVLILIIRLNEKGGKNGKYSFFFKRK